MTPTDSVEKIVGGCVKLKCDACWKEIDPISEDSLGWIYFQFKHLKPSWICNECRPEWEQHHAILQGKGL